MSIIIIKSYRVSQSTTGVVYQIGSRRCSTMLPSWTTSCIEDMIDYLSVKLLGDEYLSGYAISMLLMQLSGGTEEQINRATLLLARRDRRSRIMPTQREQIRAIISTRRRTLARARASVAHRMVARFPGRCSLSGSRFPAGAVIYYHKGTAWLASALEG